MRAKVKAAQQHCTYGKRLRTHIAKKLLRAEKARKLAGISEETWQSSEDIQAQLRQKLQEANSEKAHLISDNLQLVTAAMSLICASMST